MKLPFNAGMPKGLDPELLRRIASLVDDVGQQVLSGVPVEEALKSEVEARVKQTIKDKVMEEIARELENEMLRKLASKAVDKAVDKAWEKIKEKLPLKGGDARIQPVVAPEKSHFEKTASNGYPSRQDNTPVPPTRYRRERSEGSPKSRALIGMALAGMIFGAFGAGMGLFAFLNPVTVQGPPGEQGPQGDQGLPGIDGQSSILQISQVSNTTGFDHQKGNVAENFSTPILITVGENNKLFVEISCYHRLDCSTGDNWLAVEIYVNNTFLNKYVLRNQHIPSSAQDALELSGHCEGLTSNLTAGDYIVYAEARHDWLGSGSGAETMRSTLTVMEILS